MRRGWLPTPGGDRIALFMRTLLLPLACLIASFTSPAQASIPIEVSALLASPEYAALMAEHVEFARTQGRAIRITSFYVLPLGTHTYAYLMLARKIQASLDGPWFPYGEFVAEIAYGPIGEVSVSALYFKASPVNAIGGSSVGN